MPPAGFLSCLPVLEQILADCKTRRLLAYHPVRINIAAGAILDFFAINYPNNPQAMAALVEFLQTTPYTGWCRLIAEPIEDESFDTPQDRESLRNIVLYLLCNDAHVGQCVLDATVAYCVERGQLILPPYVRPPVSLCAPQAMLSHLPSQPHLQIGSLDAPPFFPSGQGMPQGRLLHYT